MESSPIVCVFSTTNRQREWVIIPGKRESERVWRIETGWFALPCLSAPGRVIFGFDYRSIVCQPVWLSSTTCLLPFFSLSLPFNCIISCPRQCLCLSSISNIGKQSHVPPLPLSIFPPLFWSLFLRHFPHAYLLQPLQLGFAFISLVVLLCFVTLSPSTPSSFFFFFFLFFSNFPADYLPFLAFFPFSLSSVSFSFRNPFPVPARHDHLLTVTGFRWLHSDKDDFDAEQ